MKNLSLNLNFKVMSLEKEFVPYELAVKLKELGWYNASKQLSYENRYGALSYIDAPLWQQAFDWFRDNHSLIGNMVYSYGNQHSYQIDSRFPDRTVAGLEFWYKTYEEARCACLEKLIEITACKSEN